MKNAIIIISIACIFGCVIPYLSGAVFTISVLVFSLAFSIYLFLRHKTPVWVVCLCVLFFLLGLARALYLTSFTEIINTNGDVDKVRGVVIGDIEHRGNNSRYEVELITINGEPVLEQQNILVYEAYPTNCVVGEEVLFEGRLQKPKNFITDTGREFDYKNYLYQQGIYAISFIEETGCVGYAEKDSFILFSNIRDILVQKMSVILPQEEGALLGGLLLGLRGNFSDEMLDYFRITGLIHIVVLSGYNVTLVGEAIRRLTLWLSPTTAMILSIISVIGFVLLAGAQTAAVRAGGMGVISLIARATHREYDALRALFFIAALMSLYNPNQLLYSTSFHMSFIATVGLLLFSPILERHIKWVTNRFQIRSIIAVTAATQLFLLPYLAYAIGAVSLIGFLANILVLPLVPIAMLFGAIVIVISLISTPLAMFISPLAHFPLFGIVYVTEKLAQVPYASVLLPKIPGLFTFILYAVLTYIGWKAVKNKNQNQNKKTENKETMIQT